MEAPLEIRYAGVVIGRAQEARSAEGDAQSFFIPARDPMPVGTVLRLRSGDQETPVRVVRSVETTDAAACGMHVRTVGEAEEVAREFIPPPAAVTVVEKQEKQEKQEKLKPATPTPVVEVDPSQTRDDLPTAHAAQTAVPEAKVSAAAEPVAHPVSVQSEPAVEPAIPSNDPANDPAPAATPVAPATATLTEVAAIPESVPITVGSSVTGALRNATESVTITTPSSEAPTVRSAPAREPASPQTTVTGPANATLAYGSVVEEASAANTSASTEDLPPARPIAGPSTRRKTKRRK